MAQGGEVDALLHEGDLLPYGEERERLHKEAVQMADLHQDLEAGFRARQALIQSANLGGDPNLALVAFAWCLGQHDADPDRFAADSGGHFTNLLWMYKWVVERAAEHPSIGRAKITELLADMTRRYQAHGKSVRPVRKLELSGVLHMLDRDRIAPALAEWLRHKRDDLSDCMACDMDWQATTHLAMRNLDLARQAAAPLFERRLSCAEVPTVTYGRFLNPLAQAGDAAEAKRLADLLPRRIGTNRSYAMTAGMLLIYLTHHQARQMNAAARRYATWALTGETPLRRIVLMIALVQAARLAIGKGHGSEPLGVLLPGEPVSAFADAESRLARETRRLALAFDARNGHNAFSQAVEEHLDGDGEWWYPL